MTDQAKQKLKYWLIGLFTGGAIATPVTAFICKGVYEKKIEETKTTCTETAYQNGLNDMAVYSIQQQEQQKAEQSQKPEPEQDDIPLTEEDYTEKDPREYDTSIPGEEEDVYLDMTDKYRGDDMNRPYIISAEEFEQNSIYKKSFVNWYTGDNVFEEEGDKISDPYFTFNVNNGGELFENNENRRDPNICYLRNPKPEVSTDFEVTRIFGSYAAVVGGERTLGETDT